MLKYAYLVGIFQATGALANVFRIWDTLASNFADNTAVLELAQFDYNDAAQRLAAFEAFGAPNAIVVRFLRMQRCCFVWSAHSRSPGCSHSRKPLTPKSRSTT